MFRTIEHKFSVKWKRDYPVAGSIIGHRLFIPRSANKIAAIVFIDLGVAKISPRLSGVLDHYRMGAHAKFHMYAVAASEGSMSETLLETRNGFTYWVSVCYSHNFYF